MPIDGIWEFTIKAPTGVHGGMLRLFVRDNHLSGDIRGRDADLPIQRGEVIGRDELFWTVDTSPPMQITLQFSVSLVETEMMGEIEIGCLCTATFDATFLGPHHGVAWGATTVPGKAIRAAIETDPLS